MVHIWCTCDGDIHVVLQGNSAHLQQSNELAAVTHGRSVDAAASEVGKLRVMQGHRHYVAVHLQANRFQTGAGDTLLKIQYGS